MCQLKWGVPIRNATKPMDLNVLLRDIHKGVPKDHEQCAVAQALKRQKGWQAFVSASVIYVKGPKWNYAERYRTPGVLRFEQRVFDREGMVQPGKYTLLPILSPRRQPTGRRQGSDLRNVTGRKRAPTQHIQNIRAPA